MKSLKVGRPATGIKRVSINISGQPEQISELKELAAKENKTVSGYIFEKCGVTMNARDFNRVHAEENGKDPSIFWGMQDYFLFAMQDGYITNFSTGSCETPEKEIEAKGRNYDYWLIEKDHVIYFYKMVSGKAVFEKKINGTIEPDKKVNSSVFGAIGGGLVSTFSNYKIVES